MADDLRARLARARLYVISAEDQPERQADILRQALDGGADVVQLRAKTAAKESLLAAASSVAAHARRLERIFIVNDHLDLAMEVGADGVHLGQEDGSIGEARRTWGPGPLIGRSTHSPAQVAAAVEEGADYIGIGPVYRTPTKPGRPAVGLQLVREVAKAGLSLPWFAIGGVDWDNIPALVAAGAERIAVVRAVCNAASPMGQARIIKALLERRLAERLTVEPVR